jgi:hypothetical protein
MISSVLWLADALFIGWFCAARRVQTFYHVLPSAVGEKDKVAATLARQT